MDMPDGEAMLLMRTMRMDRMANAMMFGALMHITSNTKEGAKKASELYREALKLLGLSSGETYDPKKAPQKFENILKNLAGLLEESGEGARGKKKPGK